MSACRVVTLGMLFSDIERNVEREHEAGWRLVSTFVLPSSEGRFAVCGVFEWAGIKAVSNENR